MKKYKIALLKGDGIGPEIIYQTTRVLNTAAKAYGFTLEFVDGLIGGAAFESTGSPLPFETIKKCQSSDAVLLGAVGGPQWDELPANLRPEAGLLGIRKVLGLYSNIRPARIFTPLIEASPLKPEIIKDGLDIVIVRELTGGIYFGDRGRDEIEGEPFAYDTERYSKSEIVRIAKTAFELAMQRNKKVCSVDKANVLESSRLWRETVCEVAKDYAEVKLSHMYVDNCAMQMVKNPTVFDVIVTSNMFGDILSDEASVISGSIGMLASASLGDGGFGLYEPVHGSAPDIAGTNTANPLAAILSAAMMLRTSLNETAAADAIERAVNEALKENRTADIYTEGTNKLSCNEMGSLICSLIQQQ